MLDELGQQGAVLESNDATARVINDYRIIEDPPDRRYRQLARPRKAKRPVLPSCATASSAQRASCASLRGAEMAMLSDSARAGVITAALRVTIDRDSTAIRARNYAAAQRQYTHFKSLHHEARRVLKSKGASGARVAAILRGLAVSGGLSVAQSEAALSAVEASLTRARLPAARLDALAKSALEAHETDALISLASPNG